MEWSRAKNIPTITTISTGIYGANRAASEGRNVEGRSRGVQAFRVGPKLKHHPLAVLLAALDEAIAETPPERIPSLLAALSSRLNVATSRLLCLPAEADSPRGKPDENLSVDEAARRMGVSADWVYRHAHALPFALRIGRRLCFSAAGLEKWSRQRQGRA